MEAPPELSVLSVSAARDILQDTLDAALPVLVIEGEVSGFNINKNTFVFFDIKDESSVLRCFMMRRALVQPLEDGMKVRLVARPSITAKGQLSMTVEAYKLVGEGSLARAFEILRSKLDSEGLFAEERKRELPYPPERIGLIASSESAAYGDFIKILDARWGGIKILHMEAQVQGDKAPQSIASAIDKMNQLPETPEIIVITRGGGSSEDLAAFNTELVARAIAGSRIPTLVAIGHERDISLAELVADKRASTPSNAAELLTPDKKQLLMQLKITASDLKDSLESCMDLANRTLVEIQGYCGERMDSLLSIARDKLEAIRLILQEMNPETVLRRGYALLRSERGAIKSVKSLQKGQQISLEMHDGRALATIDEVQ